MRITVDSVTHSYGSKKILSSIYLKGDIDNCIGVFGLNGCGKTTLFNIICGQLKPDSGIIKIDGAFSKRQQRYKSIGILSQHSFLPKNIKVRKAIRLFCNKVQSEFVLGDERISSLSEVKVYSLSKGENRYLEF